MATAVVIFMTLARPRKLQKLRIAPTNTLAMGLILLISLVSWMSPAFAANNASTILTGVVKDPNGSPIPNVRVLTDGSGYQETRTDADGLYTLSDVGAGSAHLRADISDKAASHYWNFAIASGQTHTANFTLKPGGASISGQVRDDKGKGLAGVFVQVWENTGMGPDGADNGAYTQTTTDKDGYFTTSATIDGGLPSGSVRVRATDNGISGWNYAVPVTAGEETSNVLISLVSGTASISGHIQDGVTGLAVSGAEVVADNGIIMAGALTGADGNYLISGLLVSGYNIVVKKTGYASAHAYNISVTANTQTRDVNFDLTTQMGTISGRVTDALGSPLANSGIIADTDEGTGFASGTTDDNGCYTLSALAPMSYFVHASKEGFGSLIRTAIVQNGQNTPNTDFSMGLAPRKIKGHVTKDGQLAAYAGIYANSSSGTNQSYYASTNTDEHGDYTLRNLPAGEYDVHISGVPGYINQVFYNVTIAAEDVENLNFNLTNGGSTINGRVTDPSGKPLAGVRIQPFLAANPGTWSSVFTDGDGNFSVPDLWAGPYNIFASLSGFSPVVKHWVQILPSASTRVDFILGNERVLFTRPASLYAMTERDFGTYDCVVIEVSSGLAVDWTAAVTVPWLLLGDSGEVQSVHGHAGDTLVVRYAPDRIPGPGLYTAQVTISAPDATSYNLPVTMLNISELHQIFLPITVR